MVTIAEFRIPASDIALGEIFKEIPSLNCEVEQVVAADGFKIWLNGADFSTINSALAADITVDSYSIITVNEDKYLYNIEFIEDIRNIFYVILEECGTILTATAAEGIWIVRLRFSAQEHLSQVYERLSDYGISIDITQIQTQTNATTNEVKLTPEQYDAITAAIEYGYFEIPREISMEELADELEISHQALSERLRRSYRTLVHSVLDTKKAK